MGFLRMHQIFKKNAKKPSEVIRANLQVSMKNPEQVQQFPKSNPPESRRLLSLRNSYQVQESQ